MSQEYEFEVTWGMIYYASNPKDALKQALGDLAEVMNNPDVGPNIFVVKNMDDNTESPMEASSASESDYWCAICEKPIEDDDVDARHSTVDGEDCHEGCCVICALEGMA